jgi:hypothetical protein
VEAVFSNITFPLTNPPAPLTGGQISEIKRLLSEMPPVSPGFIDGNAIRSESHLAFYRGSDLQVEHFLPGDAPVQMGAICRIMGLR